MFRLILGVALVVLGLLDALKYEWFAKKIIIAGSSREYSRKGINFAIFNAIVRVIYGSVIGDIYIIGASLVSLVTISYCWWAVYLYYPYRNRGLIHFKRPHPMIYFINSCLPNTIRRKL